MAYFDADPTIINSNYDDCLSLAIHSKSMDLSFILLESKYVFDFKRINLRTSLTHFAYAVLKNQFEVAEEIRKRADDFD